MKTTYVLLYWQIIVRPMHVWQMDLFNMIMVKQEILELSCLRIQFKKTLANRADPDQTASEEAV